MTELTIVARFGTQNGTGIPERHTQIYSSFKIYSIIKFIIVQLLSLITFYRFVGQLCDFHNSIELGIYKAENVIFIAMRKKA